TIIPKGPPKPVLRHRTPVGSAYIIIEWSLPHAAATISHQPRQSAIEAGIAPSQTPRSRAGWTVYRRRSAGDLTGASGGTGPPGTFLVPSTFWSEFFRSSCRIAPPGASGAGG